MHERKREIDSRETRELATGKLAAIEAELASFTPGPSRLDRDRTMFLAGRASAGSKTTPAISTAAASTRAASTRAASTRAVSTRAASTRAARRWPIGFAAMTAVAGCLLAVLIVQQQTIVALQATAPIETIESGTAQSPESPGHDPRESEDIYDSPASQEPDEPPPRRALVDDSNHRRFDFSDERLLTMADSGTLTVRSFLMPDEFRTITPTKPAPKHTGPKRTFEPPSPPMPYYKLLRQFQ